MNEDRLQSLLQQYRLSRDTVVRDEAFTLALPLAYAIARRFIGRGVEKEDLEQVAAMALIKAMERFEPDQGYRFSTFAVPTITGELRNYLRDKGDTIRLPRNARNQLYRMEQTRRRFEQQFLRQPSAMELAKKMGISPDELLSLINMQQSSNLTSLDAPIGEDGGSSLDALLGADDDGFKRSENAEWMKWVYSLLADQEKQLVTLRYQERLGQRETAKRLGISQMQVSRMERRLLERLRAVEQQS